MELRCPNGILHGVLGEDFIEFKCRSKRCGAKPGVVVIHQFSHGGELLQTRHFKDPAYRKEGNNESSLRSA